MKKTLILIFTILLFICGCRNEDKIKREAFIEEFSYYNDNTNVPSSWDWFDINKLQESLEKKKVIKCDFEEIKEKIESGEKVVIYYGFDPKLYQCPYCVASLPSVESAAVEADVDVYYLDIRTMRVNNTEEYLYLYNGLLETYPDFGEKIPAPTYVTYVDKVPIAYHIATLKGTDGKYLKDLSDIQEEELTTILKEIFLKNEK